MADDHPGALIFICLSARAPLHFLHQVVHRLRIRARHEKKKRRKGREGCRVWKRRITRRSQLLRNKPTNPNACLHLLASIPIFKYVSFGLVSSCLNHNLRLIRLGIRWGTNGMLGGRRRGRLQHWSRQACFQRSFQVPCSRTGLAFEKGPRRSKGRELLLELEVSDKLVHSLSQPKSHESRKRKTATATASRLSL